MPSGVVRFFRGYPQPYRHPAFRQDQHKLLILSAAYPQPGWGVLLNFPGEEPFESLLSRTIESLTTASHHADLAALDEAKELFNRRREVEDTRPVEKRSGTIGPLDQRIASHEKAFETVQHVLDALHLNAVSIASDRIVDFISMLPALDWPDASEVSDTLRRQRELLDAATSAAIASDGKLTALLESAIHDLETHSRSKQEVFGSLPAGAAKQALAACLRLREDGIARTVGECCEWANNHVPSLKQDLHDILHSITDRLRDKLVTLRGERAQAEAEHDAKDKDWRARRRQTERDFRAKLEKATFALLDAGPSFLVAFEKACREAGLWARSIPWDPARMVGWKLKAFGVSLQSIDLWTAAKQIVDDPPPPPSTGEVEGSYFTDYVHFVAISCPRMTPFAVTQQLVAKLLLPSQLIRIIQAHGESVDETADPLSLAARLLRCFGWNESDPSRETPLEYCLDRSGDGPVRLRANLTVHDLRKVVESFCKDLVDVAVQVLGFDTDRIWEAIHGDAPYRPRSQSKDWDDEVSHLTVGSAEIVLKSLLPLAWPAAESTKALFETLAQLRPFLNASSHHSSDQPPDSITDSGTPNENTATLIDRLLRDSTALVGEMPWHMTATIVYGEQPKVLSGEAWSHSSATPRLIRVIDWNRRAPGRKVTLWNKSGRNPVIADPEFIRRPLPPDNQEQEPHA